MSTFLKSASFSGSYPANLSLYYDISQSTSNNQSTIKYYLYMYAQYWISDSGRTAYINGTGVGTFTGISSGQTILLGTLDQTITHNDAGEATANYSASLDTYADGSASLSGSFVLPTIPRASSPTCANTDLDTSAVIYLNRKSTSFNYKLEYQADFETSKTLLGSGLQQDTFSWTMPTTWYEQIPNKSSITITIYETTYSGDTQVGSTNSCTFNATVPTTYKPTIANITTDVDALTSSLTGTINSVILGYTTLTIGATATTYKSATFTKFIITTGGGISSESTVNPLQKVYNPTTANVFNIVAIDSRGYQSDTYQLTLTTIPYAAPTITGKLYRTTPTTNDAILTANGYYKSGKFGSNTNAQSNSITIKYDYKKQSDTDYTTGGTLSDSDLTLDTNNLKWSITSKSLGSSLFDYKSNYIFRFVLTDKVTSSQETTITLLKGQAGFAEYETHLECNGELLADWDNDKLKVNVDLIYPIGSYYFTSNGDFKPSDYFGGTWEQITSDAYIKIVSTNGGALGGTSSDHKIPIESMPSHTHRIKSGYDDIGSYTTDSYRYQYWGGKNNGWKNGDLGTDAAGGGQAYYPYYLGAYCWHRTA